MEQKTYLVCPGGKQAVTICMSKKCKHKPLTCFEVDCLCSKNHIDCMDSQLLNRLDYKLIKLKGDKRLMLEEVAGWCQTAIKKLTLFLQQVNKGIQQTQKYLKQDQRKLSQIIKQRRSNDITQQLIMKVSQQMEKYENETNDQIFIESLKEKLDFQIKEIEQIIKKARNYINQNNTQKKQEQLQLIQYKPNNKQSRNPIISLKFSETLHHPSIQITKNTIKKTNFNKDVFCLLEPALEQRSNSIQRFRFKINKSKNKRIQFGLVHKQTIINNNFQLQYSNNAGFYSIQSCNGKTHSHSFPNQDDKATNIKSIDIDQQIQISYDDTNKKMIVTNISTNQTASLNIKTEENNPISLAVLLFQQGQQVQFIGQIITSN